MNYIFYSLPLSLSLSLRKSFDMETRSLCSYLMPHNIKRDIVLKTTRSDVKDLVIYEAQWTLFPNILLLFLVILRGTLYVLVKANWIFRGLIQKI